MIKNRRVVASGHKRGREVNGKRGFTCAALL